MIMIIRLNKSTYVNPEEITDINRITNYYDGLDQTLQIRLKSGAIITITPEYPGEFDEILDRIITVLGY